MSRTATALVTALLTILAACEIEEGTSPTDGGEQPGPGPGAQVPTTLIYVDHTTLMAHDLGSDESSKLAELPTADVSVAPAGDQYVTVEEASPSGLGPEGFRRPVLLLGPTDGGAPERLGPGRTPAWSPDGDSVAAVARAKGYRICSSGQRQDDQVCRGAERVVAYGVPGGESRALLGADQGWSIMGWTDEERVAAIAASGGVMFSAAAEDEATPVVGFSPSEIWGVSPTELKLLVVEDGEAYFASPGESRSPAIDLGGRRLGDGAWAPDGSRLVAVLLGRDGRSKLGTIDVDSAELTSIEGTEGAHGNVVWGPDGSFAYVRAQPRSPGRLQAVTCSPELECEPRFAWKEGVSLLALTAQ